MIDHLEGLLFLKEKYDLHNTPEVYAAARRTEKLTGTRVPQKPTFPIQNYLDRFHQNSPQAIKRAIFPRFITKINEFPESYHEFNSRVRRERGEQADWENLTPKEREAKEQAMAKNQIADQQASLGVWIDFFACPGSGDLPDYFKYWVFRSITDLKQFDKEKKVYPQRSKGTVDLFPEINAESLRYIHTMLSTQLNGDADRFDCDLTVEQEEELRKLLGQGNFPRLYAFANELIQPISERLLQITEGRWVKYPQGSDPSPLFESIRGRGTGWCTIGGKNAESELAQGDFHCYYSSDGDGNPVIPRIAIRMRGSEIFELRGVVGGQNIDPYMDDVLTEKLTEFPDQNKYFKRKKDMALLTDIERRMKAGKELNTADLRFLYEMDDIIEGFGIKRDPRIKELLASRDPRKDLLVAFSEFGGIAGNPAEINESTKVYIGTLTPEVLQARNIEYIFSAFPRSPIRREIVSYDKDLDSLQRELSEKGAWIKGSARRILKTATFGTNPRPTRIVWLQASDLDLDEPALIADVIRRAKEIGLKPCPSITVLHLRLAHLNQSEDERLLVGNEPILNEDGEESIFSLLNNTLDGLLIDHVSVWDEWTAVDRIAFSTFSRQS